MRQLRAIAVLLLPAAMCLVGAAAGMAAAEEGSIQGLVAGRDEVAIEGKGRVHVFTVFDPDGDAVVLHADPEDEATMKVVTVLSSGEEVKASWRADGERNWLSKISVVDLPTKTADIKRETAKVRKQQAECRKKAEDVLSAAEKALSRQMHSYFQTMDKTKELKRQVKETVNPLGRKDLEDRISALTKTSEEMKAKTKDLEEKFGRLNRDWSARLDAFDSRLSLLEEKQMAIEADHPVAERPDVGRRMVEQAKRDEDQARVRMEQEMRRLQMEQERRRRELEVRRRRQLEAQRKKEDAARRDTPARVSPPPPVRRHVVDEAATVTACSTRKDRDRVIYIVGLKLDSGDNVIAEVTPDAGDRHKTASTLKTGDRVNVKGTATGVKLTVTSLEVAKDKKE